jgi:ubiquinone/menaquinone biosynthesis C-methylase UbiE
MNQTGHPLSRFWRDSQSVSEFPFAESDKNDPVSAHDHAGDGHGHQHGHDQDRGLHGFLRYMRMLPKMWRSPVSADVVRSLAPQPGERVLDLGAGMGPATVLAAKTGASVLAVDPTPFMRRILSVRRLGQRHRTAIHIADGSAESIPTADQSVDALWTVNTVHHWTDLDAAVHELARVLRPGGRLLLVDEDFDDPEHPAYQHMQDRKDHRARHFAEIDPVAVSAKLRAAGFAQVEGSTASMAGRPVKMVRATR